MSNKFEFYLGLRGYHVYHNTVNWKPYVKQKIALKREHNNEHDKFEVAGRVTMRGRFGWIVVGHIPKELSCYVWYSIQEGEVYDVEVYKKKPMASPLLQGGLEIPIKVCHLGLPRKVINLHGKSKRCTVPYNWGIYRQFKRHST